MKLRPEVLRFAFLLEEVLRKSDSPEGTKNLAELFADLTEVCETVAEDIDFENLTLTGNPKLFARSCAAIAIEALRLVDNVNQLPILRHGLVEAINDHLP